MKVRVLSPAIDEIVEASLWFDAQSPGLGDEFWRAVDALLSEIERNPHRFGKSEFATPEHDLRDAMVQRFKYVIHHCIDVGEVQVISVAHAARKLGYWLRRIKR